MTDIEKIKALTEAAIASKEQNISELFSYFIRLYISERIAQTNIDEDGDMLLYQWGTYRGFFEVDLTRQIMLNLADPDEAADSIVQLSVTFRFNLTADTMSISNGNCWCNTLSEVEEFKTMLTDSAAFIWAQQAAVVDISVSVDKP